MCPWPIRSQEVRQPPTTLFGKNATVLARESMKKTFAFLVVVWTQVCVPNAIGEDFETSANVTLTSDYTSRGWSQTTRDPAIQGGFDMEFIEGFSIGTWASNVNLGSSTTMEWSLYASYSYSFSDDATCKVTVFRMEFPSEGDAFDFVEFDGSITFKSLTTGLTLSPSYSGANGPFFHYPYVQYSTVIAEDLTLDFHVGLNKVDTDDYFGVGHDSYLDFSASVTRPFHGIEVSAALVGTNLDDSPDTEARIVVSLSKSL